MGLLAGLIFDVRNPNVIIIIFYIFYDVVSVANIKNRFAKVMKLEKIFPCIIGGVLGILPQLLYWYAMTDNFFIRSYPSEETFSWFMPHIINGLFSVQKGLVFWSPIVGLAICGLCYLKRYDKSYFAIIAVIVMHMYITFSWDCWTYGGSFGQRPFVDMYVFYAIGLAAFYAKMNSCKLYNNKEICEGNLLRFILPLILILVFFELKAMLAYWEGIIPFNGATMTDILNMLNWEFSEIRANLIR